MRVEEHDRRSTPRASEIWELRRRPERLPALHATGVTRCEREGDDGAASGLGARYSMRMRVGSADVGGLVEVVELDEPGDLPGPASRASTSAGAGACARPETARTRVTLRLAYERPGRLLGMISDRCRRRWWRATSSGRSRTCKREIEGGADERERAGTGFTGRIGVRSSAA